MNKSASKLGIHRSKTSKMKDKDYSSFINPRIALAAQACWLGVIGFGMAIFPAQFTKLWGLNYTVNRPPEQFLLDDNIQTLGFWYLIAGCIMARGQGNARKELQSMLCILSAIGLVIAEVFLFVGWSDMKSVGATDAGQWFNFAMLALFIILSVLGSSKPETRLPEFKSSLYWGYYVLLPLLLALTITIFVTSDFVAYWYGIEKEKLSDNGHKLVTSTLKYLYPSVYIYIMLTCSAMFLVADAYMTSGLNRMMWAFFLAGVFSNATSATTWGALKVGGKGTAAVETLVESQLWGLYVSALLSLIFYVDIVLNEKERSRLFKEMEDTLEKAESPREVDAENVPDKEDTVEPLLGNVGPLVPTLPSYTTSYTGYPSTYATAAPVTTSYVTSQAVAAPMQRTYAAPMATVGVDLNHNHMADVVYTGVDLNRDGIPDALQQPRQVASAFTAAPLAMAPAVAAAPVAARPAMVLEGR